MSVESAVHNRQTPQTGISQPVRRSAWARTGSLLVCAVVSVLPAESVLGAEIQTHRSRHLVLHTDVSHQTARMLMAAFESAWGTWVDAFGPPPGDQFRITGCVMADPSQFASAGLLPPSIETFLKGEHPGKHRADRFWMKDQRGDYYRRHLMIHEATHCFMTTRGGPPLPVWYLEGTAELFATHVTDPKTGRFRFGVMPSISDHLPEWGRLGMMRRDIKRGRLPRFESLGRLWRTEHAKIETYAWSWAYCRFLASHPTYKSPFAELGRHLADGQFQASLDKAFGRQGDPRHQALQFEWQLVARDLVPGWDFERAAIQFVRTKPLGARGAEVQVRAGRGWQSTGIRVARGETVSVRATGQFTLAQEPKPWVSTADGISFRYPSGLPLGRLVGVVQPARIEKDVPPRVISLGARGELTPAVDGTLFLRLNDFQSELRDNTGGVNVQLIPDG